METSDLEELTNKQDIPGLIQALKHADRHVREKAARILGDIGDERVVEPLFKVALDDPYSEMVGEVGDFGVDDYPIRTIAKDELKKVVSRVGSKALGSLIEHHAEGGWGSHITHALLLMIGLPAVAPLIESLKSQKEYQRMAAAFTLGDLGDPQAVEPLIAALRDKEDRVREKSAEALGKIGDLRAVEPLITALDTSWIFAHWWGGLSSPTAVALGKLGDSRAIEPLAQALKNERSNVRWSAAEALAMFGDSRVVEALITALQDEEYPIRRRAAEALANICDPRALKPLTDALIKDGKDSDVGKFAMEAKQKIREKMGQG